MAHGIVEQLEPVAVALDLFDVVLETDGYLVEYPPEAAGDLPFDDGPVEVPFRDGFGLPWDGAEVGVHLVERPDETANPVAPVGRGRFDVQKPFCDPL